MPKGVYDRTKSKPRKEATMTISQHLQLSAQEVDPEGKLPRFPTITPDLIVVDSRDRIYNVQTVQILLDAVVQGMPAIWAARLANVAKRTYHEWLNTRPDFVELVEQAKAIRMSWITGHVMSQVPKQWAAGVTVLERAHPEDWGRKEKHEVVHSGGVGLNVQQILISPESIAAWSEAEGLLQQEEAGQIIEGEVVAPMLPAPENDRGTQGDDILAAEIAAAADVPDVPDVQVSSVHRFAVGERVYVDDVGLERLRRIMRDATGTEPAPNHHGVVLDPAFNGSVLIMFDDGGSAPYPPEHVHLLEKTP